ncbi:MAG TPA: HPP family protein [Acidocella sp.]|nr:HPP family protein [Acidocella sp.]
MRFFAPVLSGATLLDRLIACGGALIGIGLTGYLCSLIEFHNAGINLPLLVAPVGASAVLLFAVPASPLAQPWSIIGGNIISALVGVSVGRIIHDPTTAAALAVALAIGAMSLARCLHPPGGAAALTAVLGGPAITSAGFTFAFVPMGLNCFVLVGLGWLFHKLSRHSYPHKPSVIAVNTHGTRDRPAPIRVGFQAEDISGALADFGETYDINPDDLDHLLRRIEMRAFERTHNNLICADIMSRDVIHVDKNTKSQTARSLLLDHDVRTLPVIDDHRRVIGIIGLRELSRLGEMVSDLIADAEVTLPDQPAFNLVAPLTNGRNHAVIVVDQNHRLLGIVTQTDLLAALAISPRPR